jgi:uncharacterized RDD family membrane protein YckC
LAPAPLLRRFAALMIDWILCLLITGLFGNTLSQPWLPVIILIAEYGFFIGLFGMTPGMRVASIRCVRFTDGQPIGIPLALLRGALLALLVPALIMDGNLRGLHDRAAGSIVVSAP